jgi:hypothetical protein
MNSFQVVLEKIFMNNFLLSEEITSAFPKLLGNCSWVLGQFGVTYSLRSQVAFPYKACLFEFKKFVFE